MAEFSLTLWELLDMMWQIVCVTLIYLCYCMDIGKWYLEPGVIIPEVYFIFSNYLA